MKRGRFLELLVARLQRVLHSSGATVQSPGFLPEIALRGRTRPREFDVLIAYDIADYRVQVACEVKDWKRPVGIAEIQAFSAKCIACGVDRKLFVSASGFTADAVQRAVVDRVALRHFRQLTTIPESLVTQVELRYRRTLLFPELVNPHALVASDRGVPSFHFVSDQTLVLEPPEAVARARSIHGRLYHQHFLSGAIPFIQATAIVEPMSIVPAGHFRLVAQGCGSPCMVQSFNFIHEFDVLLSPIEFSLFSYNDHYDPKQPILVLAGRTTNQDAPNPLFLLSAESRKPLRFAEDRCRASDDDQKDEGDLVFHIPALGSLAPRQDVESICRALNWRTNLRAEVA